MALYEEQFKDFLRCNNLKYTKERKELLKAINLLKDHFHADDIYQQVIKQKTNVSLATVYRTIPLLLASGLITETLSGGDKVVYEKIYNKPHHDHMVCLNCGKIIEFTSPEVERLQKGICQEYSFISTEHRLELKGYCQTCWKKLKQKKVVGNIVRSKNSYDQRFSKREAR